jgi:IclR family mhp operon transcriptional activator
MAFEGAGLNARRPVLISALGRAWLAFCPDEERRNILRDIGGLSRRQEAALDELLERVRRDGYAFTQPPRPTRLHGMAVAVRQGGRVIGSLSMRFPRSAMTEEEVGARFGKRLAVVARAIAAEVARRLPG